MAIRHSYRLSCGRHLLLFLLLHGTLPVSASSMLRTKRRQRGGAPIYNDYPLSAAYSKLPLKLSAPISDSRILKKTKANNDAVTKKGTPPPEIDPTPPPTVQPDDPADDILELTPSAPPSSALPPTTLSLPISPPPPTASPTASPVVATNAFLVDPADRLVCPFVVEQDNVNEIPVEFVYRLCGSLGHQLGGDLDRD